MAETQDVATAVINKDCVFKIKEFYDFFYSLVNKEGFSILEDDFNRTSKGLSFKWTCRKSISSILDYSIKIDCSISGITEVSIKKGNIEERADRAHVNIVMRARLVTDWMNRYETRPLAKMIKGFIDKYFSNPDFNKKMASLRGSMYTIENELKSFFDLYGLV